MEKANEPLDLITSWASFGSYKLKHILLLLADHTCTTFLRVFDYSSSHNRFSSVRFLRSFYTDFQDQLSLTLNPYHWCIMRTLGKMPITRYRVTVWGEVFMSVKYKISYNATSKDKDVTVSYLVSASTHWNQTLFDSIVKPYWCSCCGRLVYESFSCFNV